LLNNRFFRIYFILVKVWKIIHDNDKGLNAEDLQFIEFQNYFLKEKSVEYVHGVVHRVDGTGSLSTDPSLNTSHSILDGRLRLEWRRGTHGIESDP
jgi:hypothetical protein